MKELHAALSAELMKVFRSKILWITFIAFTFIPIVAGFFMVILKDPEFARQSGLLGSKAQIAGIADWPSYFGFLSQAVSIGGILLFGFISSWVFGMEYSERTLKDLLALPISRLTLVLAKFTLIFFWCLILSVYVFVFGLFVGNFVVLPGWSQEILQQGFYIYFTCALLTIMLSTPVAFFACYGKGYMSPLGFVILTVIAAQIVAVAGYGAYFPWAVPALLSNIAGEEAAELSSISYGLVLLTGIIGFTATGLWWRRADHT